MFHTKCFFWNLLGARTETNLLQAVLANYSQFTDQNNRSMGMFQSSQIRKRESYITQQAQATGHDEASIPVTHTGGQQRPLGTSVLWEPSSEDDSVQGEVVITEESNIVLTQQVSPAWLGPRPKSHPKLLQATPKSQVTNPFDQIGGPAHRAELLRRNPGGEASSSTSRPVIDLTQETFQVIGNISTSDLVDGLRYCHPPPGVPLRTGNPGGLKVHNLTGNFGNLRKRFIPGQGLRFLHLIITRCLTSTAPANTGQCASRIFSSRSVIDKLSKESEIFWRIKLRGKSNWFWCHTYTTPKLI